MLLISDLHLEPNREDITRTLVDFLRGRATESGSLYILGDLFEVWIGDDDPNPLADLVARELSVLKDQGVEVFLMHGNRDFLIGKQYADRCGASLITEPYLIQTASQHIALLHGDSLCTADVEYMKFRNLVRNQQWQQDFLAKPLTERHQFAEQARKQSQQVTSNTAPEIMDVTPSEVIKLFSDLQVTTLIHGHTHRPAVHPIKLELAINGSTEANRVVLGDWNCQGWYVEVSEIDVQLRPFPLLMN